MFIYNYKELLNRYLLIGRASKFIKVSTIILNTNDATSFEIETSKLI